MSRYEQNGVRVAITDNGDGTYQVACGLFRNRGGFYDHQSLSDWTSFEVPSMEAAEVIKNRALERDESLWRCTYDGCHVPATKNGSCGNHDSDHP